MSATEWLYIISITLQLSGAVLLLIRYCFVSIEKQLRELKERETHAVNQTLILGKTQPTPYEYKESVWLNRIAFTYISAGYLLSVWGSIGNSSRTKVFFWIVLLSAFLTALSAFTIRRLTSDKEDN